MGTIPTLQLALLEQVIKDENSKEYFCRLCAKKATKRFNGRLDKLPGLETIVECCLGKYRNHLVLPTGVCDHCIQTITKFSNFVRKCEISQALLLQSENNKQDLSGKVNDTSATDSNNQLNIEGPEKANTVLNIQNSDSISNTSARTTRKKSDLHKCSNCGKGFRSSANYYIHMKTHNRNENDCVCQICYKMFSHRCDLQYHLQSAHGDKQSKSKDIVQQDIGSGGTDATNIFLVPDEHQCAQCFKTFSSPANLRVHLLSHSIPKLTCDICGAAFRTKHMHMQHIIRTHTLVIKNNKDHGTSRKRLKKGIQLIRLTE